MIKTGETSPNKVAADLGTSPHLPSKEHPMI